MGIDSEVEDFLEWENITKRLHVALHAIEAAGGRAYRGVEELNSIVAEYAAEFLPADDDDTDTEFNIYEAPF